MGNDRGYVKAGDWYQPLSESSVFGKPKEPNRSKTSPPNAEPIQTSENRTGQPATGGGLQYSLSNISILPSSYPWLPSYQPKLTISQPGDKYEEEADRVAEQVMRMPEHQIQREPG